MTPMFSAYVVVGEPPTAVEITVADAVGGDGPTQHGVEVGLGHLADRLDVTDVLGHQGDHRREHQQDEDVENDGRCQPTSA